MDSAVDIGLDDHPDHEWDAAVLPIGPVQLKYQFEGDEDVIAVDVATNETLMTDGLEVLRPAEDSYLFWFRDVAIKAAVPTRFFLSPRNLPPLRSDYELSIRGPDIAGDTVATATAIAFPLSVDSELELDPYDQDVFAFTVPAGGFFVLTCSTTNAAISCSVLSADGAVIVGPVEDVNSPAAVNLSAGSYLLQIASRRSIQLWDPVYSAPYSVRLE